MIRLAIRIMAASMIVLVGSGCAAQWRAFVGEKGAGGSAFGRRAGDREVWTIECNEYRGPGRREMADRMGTALKRVSQLRSDKVWVEHDAQRSQVFYGNYELRYVEARVGGESHARGDVIIRFSDEIKRDLRFIKTLALGSEHPFFSARWIPKPIEDVGPPEWDLRNAKGVYSLNVGVTFNTRELHNYKQAAVEWVRVLREDGYEAYYYHHPENPRSSICVGTFGEDASITWTETVDGKTVQRSRYSEAVEALRNRSDFRYNMENAHRTYVVGRNPETGAVARMPNKSFLVKIPRQGESNAEETAW